MTSIAVRIQNRNGEITEVTVEAEMFGPLAVHAAVGIETVDGMPAYSVTHVASGRKITPCFFDDASDAANLAKALLALPVDWSAADVEPDKREHVRHSVYAISGLCNGFLVDSAMDQPAVGSA